MQRLAKLNARQLTRLYCFCILKQCKYVSRNIYLTFVGLHERLLNYNLIIIWHMIHLLVKTRLCTLLSRNEQFTQTGHERQAQLDTRRASAAVRWSLVTTTVVLTDVTSRRETSSVTPAMTSKSRKLTSTRIRSTKNLDDTTQVAAAVYGLYCTLWRLHPAGK